MLQVIARRYVTRPEHQVIESHVSVHGFKRLTPRAARAALEIAFGNANSGEVVDHETGIGYRVYAKSARKISLTAVV